MTIVLGPGVVPFLLFAVISRHVKGRSRSPPDNRESRARTIECGSTEWNLKGYQGCKRQPWRSLTHTAPLLRPMPLTVTRLPAGSSVKPLAGSHCFT
ncbi:hypothetical protein D3C78_672120 [compost metagenome]